MSPWSPSRARSRRVHVLAIAAGLAGCDSETPSDSSPEDAAVADGTVSTNDDAAPPGAGTPSAADTSPAPKHTGLHLAAPPMRTPADVATYDAVPTRPSDRVAQAFQFDAPVFRYPNADRRPMGLVRRNTRIAVDRWVPGEGCTKSWYALADGGYVCSADGFSVSSDPAALSEPLRVTPPAVAEALPYRYAKVDTPAPLYWRIPTERELAAGSTAPIRTQATGAHFVAMDQTLTVGTQTLHRTVRGFYVRDEDIEARQPPTMHGELLSDDNALPLAFVFVDDAELLEPDTGERRGTADKFARFAVSEVRPGDGATLVVAHDGFAARRDQVRVADAIERPAEVGRDRKWIHIDLDQQLLVAYEGDTPVFTTLVSSGKEGFTPPRGLFRVHKKYTSVTMAGPDPDAGTYAVEQVPWTMYYWGSFALHGAYWHDEFGNVRSHGCTNIPPVDARWLFYWGAPALPSGWHARVGIEGPWVYFTRSGAPEPSSKPAQPRPNAAP
ncbi:MAG: L,D-transpeptidase [Deltaproteobacteria bacterium]|nr:L,D-transpeptidase [Deltaproteobacteria bacterium]